jgi:catechol 2,3-dioxygenase-like lactoylglutathione lyase family enzyme
MALITGTDFLTIGTTDIDRAIEFYGGVLGLEKGKRWGNLPAVEFETGNLTIALMQVDAFGIDFRPTSTPLEFQVEDFKGAKAELESRGVKFLGNPIDSGVCCQAFFQDPDGNTLGIHHRYAEGAPPQPPEIP